jgi:hypothetical protein
VTDSVFPNGTSIVRDSGCDEEDDNEEGWGCTCEGVTNGDPTEDRAHCSVKDGDECDCVSSHLSRCSELNSFVVS